MSLIVDGTTGVTFNDSSLQGAAASPYVLKNRIINGAMVIDQRNAGASVTPANTNYTLDRWIYYSSQSSKLTIQQNAGAVTPPAGFNYYAGITSTSAFSIAASDYFAFTQNIEGYNIADLAWGTASAKTITLSFWVRSSLTGTFGGAIKNRPATRGYPFTYTILAANTWEQKSITIAGDTSGTWLTTNGVGFELDFGLGVGSTYSGTAGAWAAGDYISATGATSVVGTNGATWYITGVQLEQNTSATPFERRLYGQEFINCQRYFTVLGGASYAPIGVGASVSSTGAYINVPFPVAMRAAPTLGSFSNLIITDRQTYDLTVTAFSTVYFGLQGAHILTVNAAGAATNRPAMLNVTNGTSGFLQFTAEL
jgi:hypothetical protein